MQGLPQEKDKRGAEVKVRINYTDGHWETRIFPNTDAAVWGVNMEGDHVRYWEYL